MHTEYVHICQYIILVRCDRALYAWAPLGGRGHLSALGMSIFLNMLYWLGVVGLCTCGLNWGVCPHWVQCSGVAEIYD